MIRDRGRARKIRRILKHAEQGAAKMADELFPAAVPLGDRYGRKGVVTLLEEEHENSAPRTFSSDGSCLAPHIHRRRPKGFVRS